MGNFRAVSHLRHQLSDWCPEGPTQGRGCGAIVHNALSPGSRRLELGAVTDGEGGVRCSGAGGWVGLASRRGHRWVHHLSHAPLPGSEALSCACGAESDAPMHRDGSCNGMCNEGVLAGFSGEDGVGAVLVAVNTALSGAFGLLAGSAPSPYPLQLLRCGAHLFRLLCVKIAGCGLRVLGFGLWVLGFRMLTACGLNTRFGVRIVGQGFA